MEYFLVLFTLFSLCLAILMPELALLAMVFFLPWHGLEIDPGIKILPHQILLLCLALVFLLQLLARKRTIRGRWASPAFALWYFFAIVWTLITIFFLPQAEVLGGIFRSPVVRAFAQILNFILTTGPVILFPLMFSRRVILPAGKVYLISSFILASLGWFQVAWRVGTGFDPLPIGVFNNIMQGMPAGTRSGEFLFGQNVIFRMSSLGGEPKTLGLSLLIAVIVAMAASSKGLIRIKFACPIILFFVVSILATFSTGSFYLLFLVGFFSLSKMFFRAGGGKGNKKKLPLLYAGMGLLLPVLLLLFLTSLHFHIFPALTLLYERTLGRSEPFIEDFDQAILSYFQHNPEQLLAGVGMGNAHLYADPFLPPSARYYAARTPFTAKSGYLRLLSEIGLIGITLFLGWVHQQYVSGRKARGQFPPNSTDLAVLDAAMTVFLWGFIFYMSRGAYIVSQFLTASGLLILAAARFPGEWAGRQGKGLA